MIESALLAGYLVFWGAMGLAPLDPQNWVLSSVLPLTFVAALVFGRRSVPLSVTSYGLIAGFLALHTVGAHYTYAQVPVGQWLQGLLGLERNHFDRVTHFAFGLLLTYPLFELFHRLLGGPRRLLLYLTFVTQLGLAGAWEIIESVVAQLTRPDLGAAFLGAQGDPWDAQHDMLAAIAGTVLALLLTMRWPRPAPSPREARRPRPSRASRALLLLLIMLVVALQLQRGAAEAHHNYDAPLTIEAPWALQPCDLALCAYPALVVDPLASSLAWLRLAAGVTGRLGPDPGRAPEAAGTCAPDAPRAPPLRSHTSSS